MQLKTEPHSFFGRAEEVLFFDLINYFLGPRPIYVPGLHYDFRTDRKRYICKVCILKNMCPLPLNSTGNLHLERVGELGKGVPFPRERNEAQGYSARQAAPRGGQL